MTRTTILTLMLSILAGCVAYESQPSYIKPIAEAQCKADGLDPGSEEFLACQNAKVQRLLGRDS